MPTSRRQYRPDPETGLYERERKLIDVLASVHQEFGVTRPVTHQALQYLTDEAWAGSLANLALYGYIKAEKAPEENAIGYVMTEKGWALFAGVPLHQLEAER